MKRLNGAEIVIECLKEQRVDTVFGYPGGSILNIYDALYKHQDEITHILRSEERRVGKECRSHIYLPPTNRELPTRRTDMPGLPEK